MNIPVRANDEINKTDSSASNGVRKQPKWKTELRPKGTRPSPRSGHTAVIDDHSMYIFGGRDGNTFKNDLFAYNFDSNTWYEIATTGTKPPPCYGHKAVCYRNQMIVFGGHAATAYLNDLWALNLDTKVWEKIETQGSLPSPRWQHSMVVWRGLLIVFGGCDSSSYLNDLYSFDFERSAWQPLMVEDYSIPPSPRMMHGAIIFAERMLVFGGQCVDSIRNDFFEFNFDLNTWNFIGVAEGRIRRNFTCQEIAGNFLLFGGYAAGLHNDIIRFDFETGTWETVEIHGKAPTARAGHTSVIAMTHQTFDERLYVFGGLSNDGALNDMYVLSLGYLNHSESSPSLHRSSSYTDHELFTNSPLDPLIAISPHEGNYMHRHRSASNLGADREVMAYHTKDEGPMVSMLREELQKAKQELEEYRRENFELKREVAHLKAEKAEESNILLY